jgi:hypothetical protein
VDAEQGARVVTQTKVPKSDRGLSHDTDTIPLETLYEVNERCLEALVNMARAPTTSPLPLVNQLRDSLRSLGPEDRKRASQRAFLLVDMEFGDLDWWQAARSMPSRRSRPSSGHKCFARQAAVPLARCTLILAWHCTRSNLDAACVLLGLARPVAQLLATIPLAAIDQIAERQWAHVQPRWHDHPVVWRQLLLAATSADAKDNHAFNLLGLQLMTGELLPTEQE